MKKTKNPTWLREWQKQNGSGNKKIQDNEHEGIYRLYYEEQLSLTEIGKRFKVSMNCIRKIMNKHGWKIRSHSEAKKISKNSTLGLEKWRAIHGSWCKGLTKDDPKMVALIEKGRQTQILGGKSKGKNNPMYGKLTSKKVGFRKDLEHSVRSSWEATFARICKYLKLEYEYEKYTFELSSGETYTPDFFLPAKNKFYEIKGYVCNDKHDLFIVEYPQYKFCLINEKKYDRIVKKFSNNIPIDDKDSFITKNDLSIKFKDYCMNLDKRISVRDFCKFVGISNKTIIKMYGGEKIFLQQHSDIIRNADINHLNIQLEKFKLETGKIPTKRQFFSYYKRAATIITKHFNGFFSTIFD